MTANDEREQPEAEFSDEELDALLLAADADILRHLRAAGDTSRLLANLLTAGEGDASPDERDPNHSLVAPDSDMDSVAGTLLHARAIANFIADLVNVSHQDITFMLRDSGEAEFTRLIVSEVVDKLASAYEYAVHLANNITSILEFDLAHYDIRDLAIQTATKIKSVRQTAERSLLTGDGYLAEGFIEILGIELSALARNVNDTSQAVAGIPINASGADLTSLGVQRPGLDWLIGVVWDQVTLWPIILLQRVADNSDEIQPGLYRIRGDTEHDPRTMAMR